MEGDLKVPERIFNLLKERGVTATELSRATGINASTLTQWKKGLQKPSTEAVIKIADYFGVTTDYLLTGRETREEEAMDNNGIEYATKKDIDELKAMILSLSQGHSLGDRAN